MEGERGKLVLDKMKTEADKKVEDLASSSGQG